MNIWNKIFGKNQKDEQHLIEIAVQNRSLQEKMKTQTATDIVQEHALEILLKSEYGIQVTPNVAAFKHSWFREFIEYYNAGNMDCALAILDEMFKHEPQNGLVWFWYGKIQETAYHDQHKALQYYLTGAKLCDSFKTELLETAAEQLLMEGHDVANATRFFFRTIQSAPFQVNDEEELDDWDEEWEAPQADITMERACQFLQIILECYGYDDLSRILVKKIVSMTTYLENDYRREIRKSIEDFYDERTRDIINQMYPILTGDSRPSDLTSEVVFYRETRKQTASGSIAIYQIYKADSTRSALGFLKKNSVDKDSLFIVVETPDGNFRRDIKGIHKESEWAA